MEGCLLCLELRSECAELFDINSKEWIEYNIKSILHKYLWPMNHVDSSSWMCATCWRELYGFHKFYLRIEETHKDFSLMKENELVFKNTITNNEENLSNEIIIQKTKFGENPGDGLRKSLVDDLTHFLNECDSNENHQSEIIMDELKPSVKNDLHEKPLPDCNPLLQSRKRGRPRKNSCYITNKPNKTRKRDDGLNNSENKVKHSKEIKQESEIYFENARSHFNNVKVKQEANLLVESIENACESSNDSHQEILDHIENKSSIKKIGPAKINHNEKDKFLAENFKITCFLCKIPFETFFNMRKHFDEHHIERGHVKCCNKKFYRRSILVDHVHYHLNPNYFKCNQCGKVMADRRCLELHAEIHDNNQEKNHRCDICGKGFAKLGVLKKHRMIHLSAEEKRFSCSNCGKNFASNYLLSSHYRSVHLKIYAKICDICGKSIRCKDVFERHMLQHEGKTAPSVNCDVCGLVLTDKKALKRHKDVIHPAGGQHEYTCSICSKTSPNLRAHKRHVQYKHVMGYDHKCTICDKAFKRAPTLKEHMASHTGTMLYTCPWCPKTFNSNANMHNHRKKVHPKEWEEAKRKKYSGNLPPNFKPPTVMESTDFNVPSDI